MRISRQLLDEIVEHAREEAPNECCGMVSARDGEAVTVYRARNEAASPFKYILHSQDQIRIMNAIDDEDLELGAIYHSHTRSDPVPSQTDINLAKLADGSDRPRFPGTLYMIVGVAGPEPDVRVWSIVGNDVSEVDLEVTS